MHHFVELLGYVRFDIARGHPLCELNPSHCVITQCVVVPRATTDKHYFSVFRVEDEELNTTFVEELDRTGEVFLPASSEIVTPTWDVDGSDSCLDDGATAIHARRMSNNESTAPERNANFRCVGDSVKLGMREPEILLRPNSSSFIFISR